MKHKIQEELGGIVTLVAVIWLIFVLDLVLPVALNAWGLIPRELPGLVGIATMPLLHADFAHLTGNTIPLLVLLCLLAGSRADSRATVAVIWVLGGGLLWIIGRSAVHIGASGLINGLTAFLIVAGALERRLISIIVAILVGVIYGGTLLSGVLPTAGPDVSWDGHLAGAIAGACVAFGQVRRRRSVS